MFFKKCVDLEGIFDANDFFWSFDENTDKRVIAAAMRMNAQKFGSNRVTVSHKNEASEGYTLNIEKDKITIKGDSAAGAFYALMSLKALIKESDGLIRCCRIYDYPDMKIRGFYQDVTRGRIPTVETLKELIDRMSDCKMNMLQLYVEHTYEFKEYDFCRDELGYLTKDEIKEIDEYCKERFIDFVPSLATFGHLYHLLQSDKYKHLCELKDYIPTRHHFNERMKHHTINPLLPESFELIQSLIDQYMEAFTSDYFNICCDETFDLCSDVNKEHNKTKLYIDFATKLIRYVESKGKNVMMWGDIALKYPECIDMLPDSIIYLNWDYSREPNEENIKKLANKTQLVCSGTWSWIGFGEKIEMEKDNILNLAALGYKYNAEGILNTNWGNKGNPSNITTSMYGMMLGAVVSWDKNFNDLDKFNQYISKYYYGTDCAIKALKAFEKVNTLAHWSRLLSDSLLQTNTYEMYQEAIDEINLLIKEIDNTSFRKEKIKKDFLITAQGNSLLVKWCAYAQGFIVKSEVDFDKWLEEYEMLWLSDSKPSELDYLKKLFIEFNSRTQ